MTITKPLNPFCEILNIIEFDDGGVWLSSWKAGVEFKSAVRLDVDAIYLCNASKFSREDCLDKNKIEQKDRKKKGTAV